MYEKDLEVVKHNLARVMLYIYPLTQVLISPGGKTLQFMGYEWAPPPTSPYGGAFRILTDYPRTARKKYNFGNDCFLASYEGMAGTYFAWRSTDIVDRFAIVRKL